MTDQPRLLYALWAVASVLVVLVALLATPMRPWPSLVLLWLAANAVGVFLLALREGER